MSNEEAQRELRNSLLSVRYRLLESIADIDEELSKLSANPAAYRVNLRNHADSYMMPGEVANLFGVNARTVARWAEAGKLSAIRMASGHRRYRTSEVYALLERHAGRRSRT